MIQSSTQLSPSSQSGMKGTTGFKPVAPVGIPHMQAGTPANGVSAPHRNLSPQQFGTASTGYSDGNAA